MASAGFDQGNFARIKINETSVEVKANENKHFRGLHVAVINPHDGSVVRAQAFDTYKTSTAFETFISSGGVPDGFVVAAACKDDCMTRLSNVCRRWFNAMGSVEVDHL